MQAESRGDWRGGAHCCTERRQMGSGRLAQGLGAALPCPQVALRIRPLNNTELEEGATVIAHKVGDQVRLEDIRGILSYQRLLVAGLCSGAELS